jgi:hypothetical protein
VCVCVCVSFFLSFSLYFLLSFFLSFFASFSDVAQNLQGPPFDACALAWPVDRDRQLCLRADGLDFELSASTVQTHAARTLKRVARDAPPPASKSCRTDVWIGIVVGALVALFVSVLFNVYCCLRLRHARGQPGQQQGILKFADDPFDFE